MAETKYRQDVDMIRVQDERLIHKDVLGLDYDTEYKFRVVLVRVFNDLVEQLDVSTVAHGLTKCLGRWCTRPCSSDRHATYIYMYMYTQSFLWL